MIQALGRALEQFGKVSLQDFILFSVAGIVLVTLTIVILRVFKIKVPLSDVLSAMVLAVYVSIILQLTLVCRADNSRIGIELDIFHGLMGPNSDFRWLMIAYVVLNCLLFVPFGFVISLFSFINEREKGIQFIAVLLISLTCSLIIECVQLMTGRGYYELQDLVFNTLGGVIGWGVFQIIYRVGALLSGKTLEE
ncbi:MAG: VanZ family protein [Lachnospiraceae bacterium]|nr:VanZ family protein [Lachnospiraceae bacterium]